MNELTDESPMPFGKYQGRPMEKVPATYFDWFLGQPWHVKYPAVVRYIERNQSAIDKELREAGVI